MPTQKIDPKVIFASDAPLIDKPPVFSDKTKGWDVARANDGRPEIKQMNKIQQDTDLKILWLNENSVLPYDASIDYPDGAVTLKDGSFKQLVSGAWVEFLDDFASRDEVKRGIANRYDPLLTYNSGERVVLTNGDIVKSSIDGNTNDPNVDMTGWELPQARDVFDASGLTQQKINSRFVTAKDYFAVGDGILRPVSDLYTAGSLAYNPIFKNLADVQQKLPSATLPTDPLDWCALQTAINRQGVDYKTSLLLTGGDYRIGDKTLEVKQSIGVVGVLNLSLGIARITYSGTGSAVKFKKDNYDSGVPATWIYAPIFTSVNIIGIGGNADTALELWGVSEGNFDKVSLGGTTISKFKTGVKMHKCSILNFDKMVASYIDTLFDFAEDGFSRWNTTAAVNIQNGDFYDIRTVFKCNSVSGLNAFTNWIESCDNVFLFDDTGSELITAENIRTFSNNCVMNTASSQKIIKVKNGTGRQSRVLSTSFGKNILRYTNDASNTQAAYDFDVAGTEAINLFDFSFSENDYFGKSSAVANANNLKVRLKFIENNNYHASTSNLNITDTLPSSVFTGSVETTVNSAKVFGRTNKTRSGATVIIDDQNGTASNLYLYAKTGQVLPFITGFTSTGNSLFSINADGSAFFSYIKLAVNTIRNLNGTPTSGSYVVGDRVLNSEPSILKPVTEWVCISISPLTWQQSAHIAYRGTTAQRPTLQARDQGVQYFDTTLAANGKPIWWNGSIWVDGTGVAV